MTYPTDLLRGACVEDLAWIAGSWQGTIGDDPVEEVWTAPNGGTMMGMFRWLRNGKPRFYEIIALEPHEDGVCMRVRHFSPGPGLHTWEGQDAAMEFKLTEHRAGHAAFCQSDDPDTWLIYEATETNLKVAFASAKGQPPVEKPFLFKKA
jgi:hypothetical protein